MSKSPLATTRLDDSLDTVLKDVVARARYIEDISTVQHAVLAYATETMGQAIGDLAIALRACAEITLEDGTRMTVDTASPRHRTDILITLPASSRAIHLFVTHDPVLTEKGRAIEAALPALSMDALIAEVVRPDPVRNAYKSDPETYRDVRPGDRVRHIGATLLRLAPKDGFASFRPAEKTPSIYWPDMVLNIEPGTNQILSRAEKHPTIRTSRSSSEPYRELDLLARLGQAIRQAGLDILVIDANESLRTQGWKHFGEEDYAIMVGAGLRLVAETQGFITAETIQQIHDMTQDVFARIYSRLDTRTTGLIGYLQDNAIFSREAADRLGWHASAWVIQDDTGCHLHIRSDGHEMQIVETPQGAIEVYKAASRSPLIQMTRGADDVIRRNTARETAPDIEHIRDLNRLLFDIPSLDRAWRE